MNSLLSEGTITSQTTMKVLYGVYIAPLSLERANLDCSTIRISKIKDGEKHDCMKYCMQRI